MALPPAIVSAFEACSDPGVIILTASARTARFLLSTYSERKHEAGLAAWPTPSIQALDSWLHQLWQMHLLSAESVPLLLTPLQERHLWNRILGGDPASRSLIAPDTLAALAQAAHALLHDYSGRPRLGQYRATASPDAAAFLRWNDAFESHCREQSLLSPSRLIETLAALISSGSLALEARTIYLAGFDRLSPAQVTLNRALESAGVALHILSTDFADSGGRLFTAGSRLTEIELAAQFCRTTLAAQPNSRIAILVPDLPAIRHDIDRTFRRILAPESLPIDAPSRPLPWEFSLGQPLTRVPILHAALQLLRWATRPLPLDEVTALLLSGFLAPPELYSAIARFDARHLRRIPLLQPELPLASLLPHLQRVTALTPLHRSLTAFHRLVAELTRPGTPPRTSADWSQQFRHLLDLSGWPASHHPGNSLDSSEFQALERWNRLLDELATLAWSGERVDFPESLRLLSELASETLFSPESTHAPVQVMEINESAGLVFDAIWLLDATDAAWPRPGRPNPLLPWQLQHALGMPNADPGADGLFNRAVTHRIAHAAPDFCASYAHSDANGPLRLSPLISRLNLEPASIELPTASHFQLTQSWSDESAVPWPASMTPGGADVLTLQSDCPFRAFSQTRLRSTPVESREAGLSASERGNLVHRVLESFWSEMQSHASLLQASAGQRQETLDRAITAALELHQSPGDWETAFLRTEAERLRTLLLEWLSVEDLRPPFTVLSSEESRREQSVAGLRLNLRPDRIDSVTMPGSAQPALLLLDYKTGQVSRGQWYGDRPEQPQLPLYAVLHQPPLDAVAFAQVRPGEMGLTGIAAAPGIVSTRSSASEVPGNFPAQLAAWRDILERLATDFLAGTATVAPREYPVTCKYCTQHILCRVAETSLVLPMGDEEDDTSDHA